MSYRVWDVPVRLFHWALAVAVVTSWLSGENGWMDVHFWSGYMVLALILFRVAWGFVGSTTARFARFPVAPRRVWAQLRRLPLREAAQTPGHNPLGALMVLFMLGCFLLQAVLGLMTTDEILTEGPLVAAVPGGWSERAGDLHHDLGEIVPWIVGVHVAAIVFYWLWKRHNLLPGMITGRRSEPASVDGELRWASPLLALALAAGAAAVVAAVVRFGGSLGAG